MSSDLIEQIYDAALNVDLWPNVLAGISQACGAVSATLIALDDLPGLAISPGVENSQAAYAAHWWKHDIIAHAIFAAGRYGIFSDWEMIDGAVRARHPFYQEFRRPFGLRDNVTFAAEPEPGMRLGLSLQMPLDSDSPPDTPVLAAFENLGRHVGRSLLFTRRMRPAEVLAGSAEILDGLTCGLACLDASGRVLWVNAALRALAADGISVWASRLRAADQANQDALDALIMGALQVRRRPTSAVVPLHRPSRKRDLLASVMPLSERRAWTLFDDGIPGCHVVVTIVDPDADLPGPLESSSEPCRCRRRRPGLRWRLGAACRLARPPRPSGSPRERFERV